MNHRWIARGLVAGLHALLLAALWLHRPPSLGPEGERRVTTVRLILPAPRVPPPPSVPRPVPLRTAEPRPIAPPPITQDTPTPADAAPPSTGQPAPVATAPTAPNEAPRMTLRLTLPPGYAASAAARNPALDDPRSTTARRTLEDRIADAAGATGEWVSERTSDSRTLMRRGDTCVEVLRSRIADTDPFNSSVAPRTVPMYGKPYKCK